MKFYEFCQNNSGGFFMVDDKVCHRLFIEAKTFADAVDKAEELGCYWNGVEEGIDCECCGDRWLLYEDIVDIEKYKTEGYKVSFLSKKDWSKYRKKYRIIQEPKAEKGYVSTWIVGAIGFDNIEEYAQFLANEYGWTTPDTRIYYQDGTVKEFFKEE